MSDADLLAELQRLPEDMRRVVHGRSGEDLRRPASDGGWGAVEHLAHLRDWEAVFLDRARQVIEQDRPELAAYDDALWSIERAYSSQDANHAVDEFADLRRRLVDMLAGQDPNVWEREGVHGIAGPVDLRWLLTRLHEHGRDHLEQIRQLLA